MTLSNISDAVRPRQFVSLALPSQPLGAWGHGAARALPLGSREGWGFSMVMPQFLVLGDKSWHGSG